MDSYSRHARRWPMRTGLIERGLRYLMGADPRTGVWMELPRPVRRKQSSRGERWDYGGQKSMPMREAVKQAGCWQRIRWRETTKSPAFRLASGSQA